MNFIISCYHGLVHMYMYTHMAIIVNTDQTHAHRYVWDSAVVSGDGNPIVSES